MRILHYCAIVFLMSSVGIAQDRAEFIRDKEFYLKGSATVVGNSILGKSESKAFNKLDKLNDEFKMRYIDVDNDVSTWSSSSAYFSISETARVVYASLHWTATYHGERSGERVGDNVVFYKKLEERAHNPQTIKMKLDGGAYQDITGTLVYDGENAKNKTVKSRAPYAYAAEVTDLIQGSYQANITVANIPATQGKMNGGSSAGWLLYVVYEDATQPLQYITTYYGLESIKKEVVTIDFGSFKSSENGELSTQVTIGALEGDSNLDKDQVRIYNPKSDLFLPLGSKIRPANNFFNSSITASQDMVLNRKPNSKNTLGFDIAQLALDSELNTILANSAQGVKMQFNTRGDHYFLFFVAFQTTISEAFYKEKTANPIAAIAKETPKAAVPVQQESKPEEVVVIKEPVAIKTAPEPKIETRQQEVVYTDALVEIINKEGVSAPNLRSGFYIISNVFSSKENAEKWERTLTAKGLFSNTFLRPDNNLYYVSLGNNPDALIMYELLKNIRQDEDLVKSWILKIKK